MDCCFTLRDILNELDDAIEVHILIEKNKDNRHLKHLCIVSAFDALCYLNEKVLNLKVKYIYQNESCVIITIHKEYDEYRYLHQH